MALRETIVKDLTTSLRTGDRLRTETLRMLLSALHNKEIEKRKKETGLGDDEIVEVIQSEAKKRRDAAEEFSKGGRRDLEEKEKQELAILQEYLPEQLSQEELDTIVESAIREVGASVSEAFGKVMRVLAPKVKGRAEGRMVAELVRKKLEK